MGFTKVLIAGSALFAAALAQGVSFTEWPTSVTAGQPTTLKWTGDGGAVSYGLFALYPHN